jgi:hypothetical protein
LAGLCQNDFHLKVRVPREKFGNSGHQMKAREGYSCADAQLAGQSRTGPAGGEFGFIGFLYPTISAQQALR